MDIKDLLIGGIVTAFLIFPIIIGFTLERIPCTYESQCPANYQCYSVLSGSSFPVEPIGGDMLCHKSCSDLECPTFQTCRNVIRCREKECETLKLCFPLFDTVPVVATKLGD